MRDLDKLSIVYSGFHIYPVTRYHRGTPLRVFQDMYPDDYYSKETEGFLRHHRYSQSRRGADLPWWGQSYFSGESGFRVFIVASDSLSPDAGSIVFYCHLMPQRLDAAEYRKYTDRIQTESGVKQKTFALKSYERVRSTFVEWHLDWRFLFVTDAAKVHSDERGKENSFDFSKSCELLNAEIDVCSPDLIVTLGTRPLHLLDRALSYPELADKGDYTEIRGIRTVVAPFPTGQGPTQPRFKSRLEDATRLIREATASSNATKG